MHKTVQAVEGRHRGANPWFVLVMVMPIYILTMFHRMAPSILAPALSVDFGAPVADLAVLSSATFMAYGLVQLPSGLLVDALGGRRTIFLITVLGGVSSLWFASSSTLGGATAARVFVGLGCAVCVPGVAMLAQSFPSRLYGRISGLFLSAGVVGNILAGAPLAYASEVLDWRAVMVLCGACSLLLASALRMFTREPAAGSAPGFGERARGLWRGLRRIAAHRPFRPLCFWYMCISGLYFAMGGMWWGPYLMQGCGLAPEEAGQIISVSFLVTIPGQPLFAMLSDRVRSRKKVMFACNVCALGSLLILVLFGRSMGYGLLMAQGIAFGIGCGVLGGVAFAAVREMFPLSMVGTATGCMQTFPSMVAAPVMQKLFGAVLVWRTAALDGDAPAAYDEAMLVFAGAVGLALLALWKFRDAPAAFGAPRSAGAENARASVSG